MAKYTYKEWEKRLLLFNSRSFRSNLQKNRIAIEEGIMPSSIAEWMDLNKERWHLSKYRQITERFDPNWFRPSAIIREETGSYTKAPYGSMAYRKFWDEEYRRCQEGYEINGFRAPGDLYFWLNYYSLPVRTKTEDGADIEEDITQPLFFEFHYVWAHYLEWCWKLEEDAVCLKPRGCGFSEYAASTASNTYTTRKNSRVMFCASSDNYLVGGDGVMDKASAHLDWLNTHTQRGMKKLRQVRDTTYVRTSGTKDREGTSRGWLSTIMAKVIDTPNKLRGSRCRYVFLEESGSFKGLQKVITAARGLVVTGGLRMGTLVAWGTGGDEGADGENIAGLMNCFYHPGAMGMLGLMSKFTERWAEDVQGFFFPTYMVSFVDVDHRGVVDGPKALLKEVQIRRKLEESGNMKGLIDHSAEYPFYPSEAFNQAGTNVFDRIKLEACKRNLDHIEGIPKVRKGELIWVKNDKGKITGVRFEEMPGGKVHIVEEPEKDRYGQVHEGLYIGGVDGIDYGVDNSAIGEAGSKFAIAIKKKFLNSEKTNNIYVATYVERPSDERQAFERALKLAVYYNARLNVERTRKEVISYFRQRKMLRYISKEVSIATSQLNPIKAKKRAAMEGTTINSKMIYHYINLIKEYILDYSENIFFPEMINELINFSHELRSKFDLVVAMGMCELLDEDDMALGVVVKKHKEVKETTIFGYYRDENGYKRYGPIKTSNNKGAHGKYDQLGLRYKNIMDEPDHIDDTGSSPFLWSTPDEKDDTFNFDLG